MDTLHMCDVQAAVVIGCLPPERTAAQTISFDLILHIERPNTIDDIAHTVDYVPLVENAIAKLQKDKPQLIETAAEMLAAVMLSHTYVQCAEILLRKPGALNNGTPSVRITRHKVSV